jgi:predicted regulator of Ras-like GTPase activity (Roadblock/LC7/MglB family)
VKTILQDINAVVGVTGSLVCDKEGALIARALPSVYDETMLLPTTRTLSQTMEGLEATRRRKVHELDLVFREGRIVVKNLRYGLLCILCVRNINVPLLNLTANLAARKLSQVLKEREPTSPSAPAAAVAPTVTVIEEALPEEVTAAEEALPENAAILLLDRARQAVTAAQQRGVMLRLLGGPAVKERCPSGVSLTLPPDRLDLDFATYSRQRKELSEVMEGLGYEPHLRFNSFHGHRRMKFSEPQEGGVSIDMFVDTLHMCHKLDLTDRLHLHEFTLPLADLLLSKLQIMQMDEKDLRDIYAILYDHELGQGADQEKVDANFIASICGDDWGWYKTVTMNIEKSTDLADSFLAEKEKEVYLSRARQLRDIIESAPKSLRWQARARIGEARRWYDLPEE